MIYEYDMEEVPMPDDERKMVEMGIGNIEAINVKIKDILNRRAKGGWEPYYPFSVPMLWFRRVALKKTRKN